MIAELGHVALILAFALAIAQSVLPVVGAQMGWANWMETCVPTSLLQCVLTLFAFGALTQAFVTSDFSVRLVATNSHSLKPMLYKVTGVWGNHEGSMLLWILILTIFGAMVAIWGRGLPLTLKARALSVQGMLAAAFLAFLLFTSNPFERLFPPPLDGNDLNPLLQDPGLAFHPPFLYLGYVGLSMAYSFAVAALIEGRVDAAWARWVRPWTLAAWMFLTIGIALGSYWAYYELGWGGWWFWDPVENASFMPWLAAAALLHSAIVVEKRDTLKSWTILLAIIAFSLSMVGTFIVRSGLLTSVHAFALDPERGLFILGILIAATGGALTLYAIRAPAMRPTGVFSFVSRESGLVLNNLLLAVSAAVVLVGTLMPLIREAIDGEKISVGPPFFNLVFTPFMIALALALPFGALMPWKRGKLGQAVRRLRPAMILAVAVGALVWAMQTGRSALAPIGLGLAVWLIAGSVADLLFRARLGTGTIGDLGRRLRSLPRSEWGKAVAHAGLGVTIFGVAAITAWEKEVILTATPGEQIRIGAYTLNFRTVERVEGPNYVADRGIFGLSKGGAEFATLTPEKRFYPVQQMPTTEASIHETLLRDVYAVLGDRQENGAGWTVRVYLKPFAAWIWIGMLIMAAGGVVSLTDRRYRIGAATRRMRAVPAE